MFLAVRDLWWARGRFALMVGAIGLITVLVVMLSGLTEGLGRQSTSAITSLPVQQVALERPTDGERESMSTSTVTQAQADRARQVPGVRSADPIGIATGRVGVDGAGVPATLFGIEPGAAAAPSGLRAGTAVVSSDLADDRGLEVGDRVTVAGSSLRVAAVVDDASFSHLPVVWVPRPVWSATAGGTGGAGSVLAVRTGPGFTSAALDSATGLVSRTRDGSLSAIGSYSSENGSLTMIRVLLVAISSLVIGAFFTVWTVQREGDLAVLKALGAKTSALLRDALGQALLTLLVGGLAGAAVAAGLGLALADRVPLVVDPATVGLPLALMVLVGLAGAAASLRRVVTVDPMTALAGSR